MATLSNRIMFSTAALLATLVLQVEGMDPARGVIRLFNDLGGGDSDGYVRIPNNPPAQRCYSFSCSTDSVSFVQWYETQEEAWLVFFDDVGCTGTLARVFGPSGKKKLSDFGMDDKVASFMLSESGIYPTRGIVDLCYMKDVGSLVEPHKLTTHADDIPRIRGNSTTTGVQLGIDGDNNRGTVHASIGK